MHYDTREGPQEPRSPPELHPGGLHGLRHLTKPASPAAQPRETPGIADERESAFCSCHRILDFGGRSEDSANPFLSQRLQEPVRLIGD
jgi:hypothetical protein